MEKTLEPLPTLKPKPPERDVKQRLRHFAATGRTPIRIEPDPDLLLALDHSNTVASESFSILRSRLLSVHNKIGIKSIVITSAEARDGKTLVATNLAMSLGELASKRILLVDGDLRTGKATRALKLGGLPGLGDFLQGKNTFDEVIHPTVFPWVSIAPTGVVPMQQLPEILQSPSWSKFLDQANKKFDLIIVDSLPGSAPVADLEILTAPCDAILIVVYMRRTRREALRRAIARLDSKKILGVIINNSDEIYDYDYNYYGSRSQNAK
jgi:capsular exopolysaccharide synthesis family protein